MAKKSKKDKKKAKAKEPKLPKELRTFQVLVTYNPNKAKERTSEKNMTKVIKQVVKSCDHDGACKVEVNHLSTMTLTDVESAKNSPDK